jgi:hypothetical protein
MNPSFLVKGFTDRRMDEKSRNRILGCGCGMIVISD